MYLNGDQTTSADPEKKPERSDEDLEQASGGAADLCREAELETPEQRHDSGRGSFAGAEPRRGQGPYEPRIIRKHQMPSDSIDETLLKQFIEGLAAGDR